MCGSRRGADATSWVQQSTGKRYNQLGKILAFVSDQSSELVDPAAFAQRGVDRGQTLLLLRVQGNRVDDPAAWLQLWQARPLTCCTADDPLTCRAQAEANCFTGSRAFAIDPGSPGDAVAPGAISGGDGRFASVSLPLRFGVGSTVEMTLPLQQVQVRGTFLGSGIEAGAIAGLVADSQLDASVIVPLAQLLTGLLAENPGSEEAQLIATLFDADSDGTITAVEIKNSLIGALLAPDVDLDGDGRKDHLSFGCGFTAVGATILP